MSGTLGGIGGMSELLKRQLGGGAGGGGACDPQAAPKPEISKLIDILNMEADCLLGVISSLAGKLEPVLSEVPATNVKEGSDQASWETPLAGALEEIAEKLRSTNRQLNSINTRIQV